MDIDYKAASFWWQVLLTVLNVIGWAYVIVTSKQKTNAKAIDELKDDLSKVKSRVSLTERDIKNMPSHEDMGTLHTRVNEANDKLAEMGGQLTQINHTMHLMHEFLLNGGTKK